MLGILRDAIRSRGPITVAEYFKLALTHPEHGYYMKKDVFGVKGDFTTSPEISQMFGELIAVWIANEHAELSKAAGDGCATAATSRPLHLVELGPGRGTLASDVTRVARALPQLRSALTGRLLLLEVSPAMRAIQRRVLSGRPSDATAAASPDTGSTGSDWSPFETAHGFQAGWIDSLDQLPRGEPCCFLAHEFFDALPVHKLERLSSGEWREVLIDLATSSGSSSNTDLDPLTLTYRLSNAPPPADLLSHLDPNEPRRLLEVSPSAGDTVEQIARHINANGSGFGLFADYGYGGELGANDAKGDTLRAFRDHRVRDPLSEPGDSDLTADVDFGYLSRRVACLRLPGVAVYGPASQRSFLLQMGIAARLSALMASSSSAASAEVRRGHLTAARTLLDDMGERFKFLCLTSAVGRQRPQPPPGFLPEARFS